MKFDQEKAANWKVHIDKQRSGDLSRVAFCRKNDLAFHNFKYLSTNDLVVAVKNSIQTSNTFLTKSNLRVRPQRKHLGYLRRYMAESH